MKNANTSGTEEIINMAQTHPGRPHNHHPARAHVAFVFAESKTMRAAASFASVVGFGVRGRCSIPPCGFVVVAIGEGGRGGLNVDDHDDGVSATEINVL